MKKLLVLAAGLLQIPIIKKAKEKGYYVIAADGSPNAPGLLLADKAIVDNIISEEVMLDHARREKIDGVIHPCSEVSMSVMGRINDELHLHGISRETALRATNKHLMRNAFEAYDAPSPKSYCTESVEDGYRIFRLLGKKAILKPSRNSGSRGINEIDPGTPFEAFVPLFERSLSESRDSSVMIEEFVDGFEFSIEMIIWNGSVSILQVTDKKTTGAPGFVELGHSQPSSFSDEIVSSVCSAATQGVKALKLEDCAAHAEVKYHKGRAYIMEIGARLGGDFISTELTPLSTGIDMVGAAIDIALGINPDLSPHSPQQGVAIRYFTPNPGIVDRIEREELLHRKGVYDARLYVKPGDRVCEVKSSLDRSGHVIVTAPTAKEAVALADSIVSSVKIVTV